MTLILGLQLLKKLDAKRISIQGDVELIIKQIKGEFSTKHPRFRACINAMLDFLESFVEYDLSAIPRNQNILANSLAFSTSSCKMPYPNQQYTVEMKHRPTVPDNMKYWKVFGNDKQIESFLKSKDEYEDDSIDLKSELENKIVVHSSVERQLDNSEVNIHINKVVNKLEFLEIDPEKEEFEALQLKDKVLPRGFVPLEELFDFNDVAKKPKIEPTGAAVEECNMGGEKDPKVLKPSKSLPTTEKQKYIALFKECSHVFSWSYEDLKTYDT